MKLLLNKGAHVNARDKDNWTPLHWAAWNGHTATVKALIAHNANVNARKKGNLTPLHWAASEGHVETVRVLLNAGADVNAKDDNKRTALGSVKLIKNKAKNQKGIEKFEEIIDLLEKHAQTCVRGVISKIEGKQRLEQDQSSQNEEKFEEEKIQAASTKDLVEKYIDQKSFDLAIKEIETAPRGKSQLFKEYAPKLIREDGEELLAKKNLLSLFVNTKFDENNKKNLSFLHLAAAAGRLNLIRSAIAANKDLVQQKDSHGNTALHSAMDGLDSQSGVVFETVLDIVKQLLEAGVPVETKNADEKTALDLAAEKLEPNADDFQKMVVQFLKSENSSSLLSGSTERLQYIREGILFYENKMLKQVLDESAQGHKAFEGKIDKLLRRKKTLESILTAFQEDDEVAKVLAG